MKKLILAGMLFGSSLNLMADYVAGYLQCDHSSGELQTYFIVKGQGNNLNSGVGELAMEDFLNAEYAVETNEYCRHNKIYADGIVFSYKSKAKANRKFASIINDFKYANYIKKLFIIKKGYDESDWR